MRISEEQGNSVDFATVFKTYQRDYSRLWYSESTMPTLGSVRGKIVLLTQRTDIGGIRWNDNYVQDEYKFASFGGADKKYRAVYSHMLAWRAYEATDTFSVNHLSAVGTINILDHPPVVVAKAINPRTYNRLIPYTNARHGIMVMDFPGEGLIDLIIRSNQSNPNLKPGDVWLYEDDNGWTGRGDSWKVGVGSFSYKGRGNNSRLPCPNDEVRAVSIGLGLRIHMTDQDSFKTGGKGTVTIDGPAQVNIKDVANNSGLAGKVSSIRVTRVPE